jgi:two-component system, chemotaxis family, protein-glutamate methylesterase/glutaminase
MSAHDLFVIGGSAGSIEPLQLILEALPADFPGTVLVTIHVSPYSPGHLAQMLHRTSRLPVSYATDSQRIEPGRVLIAPPDRHLLVQDSSVRLSRGPRENRTRPAIDPMFRSAAEAYRERVVAVVLSGMLDDGAQGLVVVGRTGGRILVQDPAEALYPEMPQAALRYSQVNEVLPAREIGHRLVEIAAEPAEPVRPEERETVAAVPNGDDFGRGGWETAGTPSAFACPDCHGSLWELHEGDLIRFRCRTGHAFSADTVAAAMDEEVERALWAALRSMEEKGALARKLMATAQGRDIPVVVGMYEKRLREAEEHARVIRRILGAEKARLARLTESEPEPAISAPPSDANRES